VRLRRGRKPSEEPHEPGKAGTTFPWRPVAAAVVGAAGVIQAADLLVQLARHLMSNL
jgi:hypothetical protein